MSAQEVLLNIGGQVVLARIEIILKGDFVLQPPNYSAPYKRVRPIYEWDDALPDEAPLPWAPTEPEPEPEEVTVRPLTVAEQLPEAAAHPESGSLLAAAASPATFGVAADALRARTKTHAEFGRVAVALIILSHKDPKFAPIRRPMQDYINSLSGSVVHSVTQGMYRERERLGIDKGLFAREIYTMSPAAVRAKLSTARQSVEERPPTRIDMYSVDAQLAKARELAARPDDYKLTQDDLETIIFATGARFSELAHASVTIAPGGPLYFGSRKGRGDPNDSAPFVSAIAPEVAQNLLKRANNHFKVAATTSGTARDAFTAHMKKTRGSSGSAKLPRTAGANLMAPLVAAARGATTRADIDAAREAILHHKVPDSHVMISAAYAKTNQ
jgi:hypothetical protein